MAEACLAQSGIHDVAIEIWTLPASYNDLVGLRDALHGVVRSVRQRPDVEARMDEISIDTTAGMKIFSIASASATFASPIEFTYVETTAPYRIAAFDVRAEFRRRRVV